MQYIVVSIEKSCLRLNAAIGVYRDVNLVLVPPIRRSEAIVNDAII